MQQFENSDHQEAATGELTFLFLGWEGCTLATSSVAGSRCSENQKWLAGLEVFLSAEAKCASIYSLLGPKLS